ncbi:P-loop containing nucleoside triphosphate hydrolase protein [Macrolepiota fuliginosa MF-IS2]|uniref:P-loop containing nucleoside triphosphate hydrolase protein n=1 Tax=Macrolepiota fuliginosa MF-IS2 TaxID=1400762 RepID=A0A9P6C4D4_9AGAR|nr:P-loop containing nucleoside triphosphate hydrolase protein [Macrolepiota fuliginosa MF-IS2]
MEVESASRVVDGAVVLIDSVEGVEAQTKGVWAQLNRYGVATKLVFLNKMDRPGASFKSALTSILASRLHPQPLPLVVPIASFGCSAYRQAEPGIHGLIDLVKWERWRWTEEGKPSMEALPRTLGSLISVFEPNHPIPSHLVAARTQLLDNLSMHSEELMDTLLSLPSAPDAYLGIESGQILPHLRQASLQNAILPIICGSAVRHIGTELVLDYAGELLASPLDVPHDPQNPNAPLRLLAWKVNWDPRRGWMTFVRVYSGKLTRQSKLLNNNRNQKEVISKLMLLYASEFQEVDELPFGSVGVILGLKHTRTGDTLVSTGAPASARSVLRDITPPPAVISSSVIPQSHADLEPVQNALESLARTDPSVRVDIQEGQVLIHGLGALHLEIVEGRLRNEWNVNFEFSKRRVSYREGLGFGAPNSEWDTWDTDVGGGKRISVKLPLIVRPLENGEEGDPVWDGNKVLDDRGNKLPAPESVPVGPLSYVVQGVASALSSSPHSSLAMTHVCIQIPKQALSAQATPSILTGAAAGVLRQFFRSAGPGPIMEPFINLKVTIPEGHLGKIIRDLTEHGGEVLELGAGSTASADGEVSGGFSQEGVYIPPVWLTPSASDGSLRSSTSGVKRAIHGLAPLSQFLDYSQRLRALSEGNGTFEMYAAGFKEVSEPRQMEILREIGRA